MSKHNRLSYSRWVQAGSGQGSEVPLIVLPGFPGGRRGLDTLLSSLAKERPVIAIDALGCGESEVPRGQSAAYAFHEQAAEVLSLFEALGLQRVELLGLSMGGVLAQYVMLTAPERVARATLVGTCARLRARERTWVQHVIAQLDSNLPLEEIARAAMLHQFRPSFLHRPAAMLILSRFTKQVSLSREGFYGQFRAMLEHDTRRGLREFTNPVHVVTGEHDGVFPQDMSAELAKLAPNGTLSVMPGLGHSVWIESPAEFLNVALSPP